MKLPLPNPFAAAPTPSPSLPSISKRKLFGGGKKSNNGGDDDDNDATTTKADKTTDVGKKASPINALPIMNPSIDKLNNLPIPIPTPSINKPKDIPAATPSNDIPKLVSATESPKSTDTKGSPPATSLKDVPKPTTTKEPPKTPAAPALNTTTVTSTTTVTMTTTATTTTTNPSKPAPSTTIIHDTTTKTIIVTTTPLPRSTINNEPLPSNLISAGNKIATNIPISKLLDHGSNSTATSLPTCIPAVSTKKEGLEPAVIAAIVFGLSTLMLLVGVGLLGRRVWIMGRRTGTGVRDDSAGVFGEGERGGKGEKARVGERVMGKPVKVGWAGWGLRRESWER